MDPESREPVADGLLLVGRVARAHGLRGHVIVNPETDFMEDRFRTGQVVLVGPADRTRAYEILESRIHQGRPIVRFAGICPVHAWWRRAMDLVVDGSIDPTSLISHRLGMEEAPLGYELFDRHEATKVMLTP